MVHRELRNGHTGLTAARTYVGCDLKGSLLPPVGGWALALVEAGADLERGDDTQQNTAVQYSFCHGRIEAVRLLTSLGADLHCVNITGRNTADMAIKGGSPEAIPLAEEFGLTPTSDE